MKKILVVEDDEKISELLIANLQTKGYSVYAYLDPVVAKDHFEQDQPDLAILDLMLPNISGEELCAWIRQRSKLPIIMLTAKTAESSLLHGFSVGADDYMKKPFSIKELLARIEALLKRNQLVEATTIVEFGTLSIDFDKKTVSQAGRILTLTAYEYRILSTIASNVGKIWTRDELIYAAFDDDYQGFDRTIDSHIKNLRKKLGNASYIKTIYGIGYQFFGVEK